MVALVETEADRGGRVRHPSARRPPDALRTRVPRDDGPQPERPDGAAAAGQRAATARRPAPEALLRGSRRSPTCTGVPPRSAGLAPPTRFGSPASWESPCCGTCAGPTTSCPSRRRCGWRPARPTCTASCARARTAAPASSGCAGCTPRRARRGTSGVDGLTQEASVLAEPELPAAAYGVHATVHAQLAEDALEVGLDGVGRHVERGRDLLGGVHLRQQVEDLPLPLRQRQPPGGRRPSR